MTVNPAAFFVLATLIVAGALAAVRLPSPVHAVYALAGTLLAVGLLFVACGAELVGAVQILFGAVVIPLLILCGLALAGGGGSRPAASRPTLSGRWPAAVVIAAATFAGIGGVLYASRGDWHVATWPQQLADDGTARALGHALLSQSVLPLAVAAVLALVAVAGAVVLGRVDEQEQELERAERQRREREERVRRRREDRLRARGREDAVEEEAGA